MVGRLGTRCPQACGGFSLIELLVAMALLGSAVFAHLALQSRVYLDGKVSGQHLRAHWAAADLMAQAQASVAPGANLLRGFTQIPEGAVSSIDPDCINQFCTAERYATFAVRLAKCASERFASASACQRLQEYALLPTDLRGVGLPQGKLAATLAHGRLQLAVTWWRDDTQRWSVTLGR